jgi:ABC-type lipoprotein release transport system permease subunit
MFNAFERAVAGRYLFSRKTDRFTSVIAIFSFSASCWGWRR